jgi:hypothetical protein
MLASSGVLWGIRMMVKSMALRVSFDYNAVSTYSSEAPGGLELPSKASRYGLPLWLA